MLPGVREASSGVRIVFLATAALTLMPRSQEVTAVVRDGLGRAVFGDGRNPG
jgi:hypothetical protein